VIYRALPGGSDRIVLYYCLMATWTGLGDNTELFWAVLSQSVWLLELLIQVWHFQPRDRVPQQVAFGLATTMVVPHCNSARPRGVAPAGYEGAAPLHESYTKNPSCPEGDEFVMMLRRFARKYNTCDIVEEYHNILVCPLVDGWAIANDAWADGIGGTPCAD
jgi:hypothetical protein